MDYKARLNKQRKIKNEAASSESDSDSEYELYYYRNDRLRLMKHVLKLIKSKKIKAMAPECVKKLDGEEINSMLLEELLCISNKRLKKIFDGQYDEHESSSSSSEEEEAPPRDDKVIDVISLDSISDDEFGAIGGAIDKNGKSTSTSRYNYPHIKQEKDESIATTKRTCKRHHHHHHNRKSNFESSTQAAEKSKANELSENMTINNNKNVPQQNVSIIGNEQDKVLNVLELLELQARARAIRSQLAIEAENRGNKMAENDSARQTSTTTEDDEVAIVELPNEPKEIIISDASDTELTENRNQDQKKSDQVIKKNSMTIINGPKLGKRAQVIRLKRRETSETEDGQVSEESSNEQERGIEEDCTNTSEILHIKKAGNNVVESRISQEGVAAELPTDTDDIRTISIVEEIRITPQLTGETSNIENNVEEKANHIGNNEVHDKIQDQLENIEDSVKDGKNEISLALQSQVEKIGSTDNIIKPKRKCQRRMKKKSLIDDSIQTPDINKGYTENHEERKRVEDINNKVCTKVIDQDQEIDADVIHLDVVEID